MMVCVFEVMENGRVEGWRRGGVQAVLMQSNTTKLETSPFPYPPETSWWSGCPCCWRTQAPLAVHLPVRPCCSLLQSPHPSPLPACRCQGQMNLLLPPRPQRTCCWLNVAVTSACVWCLEKEQEAGLKFHRLSSKCQILLVQQEKAM